MLYHIKNNVVTDILLQQFVNGLEELLTKLATAQDSDTIRQVSSYIKH